MKGNARAKKLMGDHRGWNGQWHAHFPHLALPRIGHMAWISPQRQGENRGPEKWKGLVSVYSGWATPLWSEAVPASSCRQCWMGERMSVESSPDCRFQPGHLSSCATWKDYLTSLEFQFQLRWRWHYPCHIPWTQKRGGLQGAKVKWMSEQNPPEDISLLPHTLENTLSTKDGQSLFLDPWQTLWISYDIFFSTHAAIDLKTLPSMTSRQPKATHELVFKHNLICDLSSTYSLDRQSCPLISIIVTF